MENSTNLKNRFRKEIFINILKWLLITSGLGIIIGCVGAGFLYSLDFVTNFRQENIKIIYFLPFAGLSIGFMYHFYGKSVVLGNYLIIKNLRESKEPIPFRMAPFVYIGTLITHLFGGSAGREGTGIQMASAIGFWLSNVLKLNKNEQKTLLIASIAAGFGAVFGTPLAGTIFALEFYRKGNINFKPILVVLFSAVFADLICNLWNVQHTHYHIDSVPNINFLMVIYTIILALIFGICTSFFMKLSKWTTSIFDKIKYPPFRPFLGGTIILILVLCFDLYDFIGLGIPTIQKSFDVQLPFYYFLIKILLTILTISSGFKGGEATPLFFIGATLGSALSVFFPLPTSLLAGLGFVCLFASTTKTPLACIFLGIELFGTESVVYIAIVCFVSNFVLSLEHR